MMFRVHKVSCVLGRLICSVARQETARGWGGPPRGLLRCRRLRLLIFSGSKGRKQALRILDKETVGCIKI